MSWRTGLILIFGAWIALWIVWELLAIRPGHQRKWHHMNTVDQHRANERKRGTQCLRTEATAVASLPRVLPFASTTCQVLLMSSCFAENVPIMPALICLLDAYVFNKKREYKQFQPFCQGFCEERRFNSTVMEG